MNALKPDIAISGGDLVEDALILNTEEAHEQYDLYIELCKSFDMPVYDIMGNHEMVGLYAPDKISPDHPDWGKELFKKKVGGGKTYRSFNHKGAHFVLLDSLNIRKKENEVGHTYIGLIGEEQMAWLKNDLAGLTPETPVIAVSHVPCITWWWVSRFGPFEPHGPRIILHDGNELINLFKPYNLIGFLQGHVHIDEIYIYNNIKFVSSGAIMGVHWTDTNKDDEGNEPGFNLVHVFDDRIETEYICIGCDPSLYRK
ncbi:MAG: hypothetical protein HOC71_00755 [Candidatus Latescibacteria bacterium]|jgi:3',5'-cyclic-AMP phosphodiesterase|nr:hypothetical protein [Candidatus Latescibacterota bacterium]